MTQTLLQNLLDTLENINTKLSWQINLDSCVKQQDFKDINAEEKYRFNYSSAFCPYTTSTTIIKYKVLDCTKYDSLSVCLGHIALERS